MYSTRNKAKFLVSKTFVRILKKKNYKYISPILKNVYINQLVDIVNE